MTIDDELLLALTEKKDQAPSFLEKMVKSDTISYQLEEELFTQLPSGQTIDMIPDVVVTINPSAIPERQVRVIIELENDYDWDFQSSLRQIKKYKNYFYRGAQFRREFIAIIPKSYERFVRLYRNEVIPVWLWSATRVWECMRCGKIIENDKIIKPKCTEKKCGSNEVGLKGIINVIFEPTPETI